MDDLEEYDDRLSRISTQWTMVIQAHQGSPEEMARAQIELMDRYSNAIHRYLLGSLRDYHAAEELDQEFALRFIRGDFHRADPARGRFRDFVRRSLRNLMIDYQRKRKRLPRNAGDDLPDPEDPSGDAFDKDFGRIWREEVIGRARAALKQFEADTAKPYFTVLRARELHPKTPSRELAALVSEKLGRALDDGWFRQTLLRARDKFIDLLIEEIARSLPEPTLDAIEEELADLELLEYCAPAIERRRKRRES
ncbi:MAG: sigma-70 family RNA polymerase sigma factor [Isosphaeraceae bacterium]